MATPGGSKPRTRQASSCKLSGFVGAGKEFSLADVPTVRAVIRRGLLLKEQKAEEGVDHKNYPTKDMARDLATLVVAQWQKANVKFKYPVIVSVQRVTAKVAAVWGKVCEVANGKGKRKDREKVADMLDRLLDIVNCQCPILLCCQQNSGCASPSLCKVKAHTLCSCSKEEKVPVLELEWLRSQREKIGEKGGMQMASADIPFSKQLQKTEENQTRKDEARQKREAKAEAKEEELKQRLEEELLNSQEEDFQDVEMYENFLPSDSEVFLPPPLSNDLKKETAALVSRLLEERLGSGKEHLVARYLEEERSTRRNLMQVPNTAAESMR